MQSAKIAVLVQQAGFPPGVINIITGFGDVSGSILSHHMDVRALSFTDLDAQDDSFRLLQPSPT
jgi:acyl-CoA reductase-like NAD-dependent aldehyde dehydrogenase